MIRNAVGKVMWIGRATIFLVGLAVVLALVFGVASTAFGANGKPFLLGKKNVASAISTLVKKGPGPALNLVVRAGQPPLKVNSATKVANLNADQLDGLDSSQLVSTNTNSFVRNSTYRTESAIVAGQDLGDGTFRNNASCLPGDVMLSGGPANVNPTSDMVESFPASTNTWAARIHKNGVADNFNVVVLCANQ